MDTPIYDELVGTTSAEPDPAAEPGGTCQWCGTPIDAATPGVEQAATDATTGDHITITACSPEHMAALESHRIRVHADGERAVDTADPPVGDLDHHL